MSSVSRSPSPRRRRKASPRAAATTPKAKLARQDVADSLSHRNDLHISRKLFHSVGGVAIALAYERYIDRTSLVALLGTFWITLLILETLRFKSKWIQSLSVRFMGSIMRRNELHQYSGMIYYMPGVIISLLFFPPLVAKLAIIYLALADPLAALVGTLLHTRLTFCVPLSRRVHGKSLYGTLAAFGLCFALTCFVLVAMPSRERMFLSLSGALAASAAELIVKTPRPSGLDDNFLIPVACALALQATFMLLAVELPLVHPL